ncbi:MAG: DinB family protein [Candidatus Eisenbacteria bacterium]
MSERTRLIDLADRAYKADAWYGGSLLEILDGVTPAMAAKHPAKSAHSIWELVEHVASWNIIVTQRMQGEMPSVTEEFNFPPVHKPTPAAWKATLKRLAASQALFRREIARFPEAKLGRMRPGVKHTWSVLIYGQVEHCLYHAAQIALLRRALGKPVPS